jgi:hypothetical protein
MSVRRQVVALEIGYECLELLAELGSCSSCFQLDSIVTSTEMIHTKFAHAFQGKVITSRHEFEVLAELGMVRSPFS